MHTKPFLTLLLLSLSIGVNLPVRAELPLSFQANYSLHYDDLRIGVMERKFQRDEDDENTGTFESNSKLTGLAAMFRKDKIKEISHWTLEENQLRPLNYLYERSGGDRVKSVKHVFDWQNKQVQMETKDGKKTLPIMPGVQDKLLYQLSLMNQTGKVADLHFTITDGLKIRNYLFKYTGTEELMTPLGLIKTNKFERDHDEGSDRRTLVWCAPSLKNLPVRVDNFDEKGHLTSIVINDVTGIE